MLDNESPRNTHKFLILALSGCLLILLCTLSVGLVIGLSGYFFFGQTNIDAFLEQAALETPPTELAVAGATAAANTTPSSSFPGALSTSMPATATAAVSSSSNIQPETTPFPTPALPTAEDLTATADITTSPGGASPPLRVPTVTASPEILPTPTATVPAALNINPPPQISQQPLAPQAFADLDQLLGAVYPPHDYFDTAVHLGKYDLGDRAFQRGPYQVGDSQQFYTENGIVSANLVTITEHAYFWVEQGLDLDDTGVQMAAQRLENEYYSGLANMYENEWQPGIDGDTHFSILHLQGNGNKYELGYFSSRDEYPRSLFIDSNEQEIIYLNMGQLDLNSDLYFGTLLHEIQHLFQWHLDQNESIWLGEGISQLAELKAGLDTVWANAYLDQPDVQLNIWEYEEDVVDAHYGASFLFVTYLWEQLGEEALRELVRSEANGLASVQQLLQRWQPELNLSQFLANWATANALDDLETAANYGYVNLELQRPLLKNRVRQLPFEQTAELNQFGVHYIDLDFSGPATITFAADTQQMISPPPPSSADEIWFVPPINEVDAQLIADFDLTGLNQATLTFSAWYDLEVDSDFAYISISTDGGNSWSLLYPHHAEPADYGPALNGRSADASDANNEWVQEMISLDSYAGRQVQIRFQVLTNFRDLGRGVALDNIMIPELSAEAAQIINWQSQGFTRVSTQLPQQWAVQLIRHGSPAVVTPLTLNAYNQFQLTVDAGPQGSTLVIMPQTPFSDTPAQYWLYVE